MATLTETFTAIANAIRNKKGVTTKFTPAQMPNAIATISTATLQSKTTTVTPGANWSGQNTNAATINPDSGYDGMTSVNVSVPMLRDNTLMTATGADTPSTVYNGNSSQSNSQKMLKIKPTKDGMSYTGSYLYVPANSYLGNAAAANVRNGYTFSSSNGIQLSGTMSSYTDSAQYINPGRSYYIQTGYHSGGYVYANSASISYSSTILYQNPSPSSEFGGAFVAVTGGPYDFFQILAKYTSAQQGTQQSWIPTVNGTYIMCVHGRSSTRNVIWNGSSLEISNGYNNGTKNDNYCIPTYVYGVKIVAS